MLSEEKEQRPVLHKPKPVKKMSMDLTPLWSEPTSIGSCEERPCLSPLKLRTRRSVHCFESEEAMLDLTNDLRQLETRSCNPLPRDAHFQSLDNAAFSIEELDIENLL